MRTLIAVVLLTLGLPIAHAQEELPAYPRVAVETSLGDFVIELYTTRAPLSVSNFVTNVKDGFYDGTVFHRIVENFVVQGGGYDQNYKLKPTEAKVPNESGNGLANRRGWLGMARTGEPHSADSQFFINLNDNPGLNPMPTRWGYTVFGRVVEGMEIIDEMGTSATGAGPIPELVQDVPKEPIVVISMTMLPEADAPAAP